MTPRTASTISNPGLGAPLAPSVRSSVEPHLGASLAGVRVHSDANAVHAATSLQARAFTVGNNIFLNRGESPSDLGLMAHESTHVVQQGAARSKSPHIARSTDEEIQRLPDFITDRLASYARHVPGYTLFTVVIGFNPLTGRSVERTPMNLVEGMMGLVPFGTFIFDQLNELGILQDAFNFISQQLATFNLSLERLERTISDAWDEMDFIRLDPFDYNLGVLSRHAGLLLDDVIGFATSLVNRVIELIKEAVLDVAEGLLAENQAWALLKKVLKWDPLRGEAVESTTVEIIEDFLILIGKEAELEQMRVRGTVEKTAAWIDTQLGTFTGLISELGSLFSAAWDAIQPENLPNLGANLEALAVRAGTFIQNVWDFALTVAEQVLQLIKDALLGWLSGFAHEIPGFHLLTVLLGRNPFTEEPVPRTAVNIIRGFISLLPGGNAMYDKLAETGVIADAGARIEGAISELGISWDFIVGIFTGIWDGLSIDDLIDPIGAFERIAAQFGEPISRLFSFIKTVIVEVFKLILALMNFPSDLLARIISNVIAAITNIMRDPIGFLINMLQALKLGLTNFFSNFLTHLVDGLVEWLFGGLREAGIEPPTDLSLASILDTVLQVLGVSMERIWEKLAERFGQETIDKIRGAIDRVVGIWNFVNDVMERGVAAIWEYVESQLSSLWDMVLSAATEWIMETIISRVVTKLLSLLDPTGIMAVVNGFIAFFNAIQSAIEYIREILEIIDSYVATFAAVAAGDIEPGAARMEGGLAAVIPVAIGFLANQVGLGNIGEKITEIVGGVREIVDQALDWLLDKLEAAIASIQSLFGLGGDQDSAEEANAAEEAGVDPADHQAFAQHALERLRTAERPEAESPLQSLELAAAQLAPSLSGQLEDGIGLTFTFPGGQRDAADGEVVAVATVAPNTTSSQGPISTGGHSKVIGESGPFSAMNSLQRSNPGLQAEHVIPRSAYHELMVAIGGGGAPASSEYYTGANTILIYGEAARAKNKHDPKPGEVRTWARTKRDELDGEHPDRVALKAQFDTKAGEWATDLASKTHAEVLNENSGTGGTTRGTSSDPRPSAAKVSAAADVQAGEIRDWLERERRIHNADQVDNGAIHYRIMTALRDHPLRGGMNSPQAGGRGALQADVPMGAQGGRGRGTAGVVQMSKNGSGDDATATWSFRVGSAQRGSGTVASVAEGISVVGAAIEDARQDLNAGATEQPRMSRINTDGVTELQGMRGIGPSIAARLHAERDSGPFLDPADVAKRVSGLGSTWATTVIQDG